MTNYVALVLDTDLGVAGAVCSFGLLVVPAADGVDELLSRPGMGA